MLGLSHCLRRLSIKYPPRLKVLNAAKTTYYIKSKNGKDLKRVSFTCALCKKSGFKSTQIQMDHIVPVIDMDGFANWDIFISRLFCDESNWNVLCLMCHTTKSRRENSART
jgi:5-methylcytosine-specific restriction endonuclease McrA